MIYNECDDMCDDAFDDVCDACDFVYVCDVCLYAVAHAHFM